jgi:hypothetical protein
VTGWLGKVYFPSIIIQLICYDAEIIIIVYSLHMSLLEEDSSPPPPRSESTRSSASDKLEEYYSEWSPDTRLRELLLVILNGELSMEKGKKAKHHTSVSLKQI